MARSLPTVNPLADTDAYRQFWNRGRQGIKSQAREQPLPLPVRRLFDFLSRENTKKFAVDMRTNHEEHIERLNETGVMFRQSLVLQQTQNEQLEKLLQAIMQWRPGSGGSSSIPDIDLGVAARGKPRTGPTARGRRVLARRRARLSALGMRQPPVAARPVPAPITPPRPQGRVPAGGGLVYDTRTNRFHDPAEKYRMIGREEAARRGASIPRPATPEVVAQPPPQPTPQSRTQRLAGFAGRILLPLTAAIAVWEAWTKIKALDPTADRENYHRSVTVIVAQVVGQVGLVWVGAIFGAALAGLITGPGAIVGFVAGLGGGLIAQYALGDSVDAIVEQVVIRLWRGPAPGSVGPMTEGFVPHRDIVYDKIVFEARSIIFDFANTPARPTRPAPPVTRQQPQQLPPGIIQAGYAQGGGTQPTAQTNTARPAALTARQQSVIGNQSFDQALQQMADRLQLDKSAILAVMQAESSLDPAAVNRSTGASGLIQFMPATARGLGTTVEAIRQMTPVQQLPYVEQFLRQARVPPGASPGRIYASIFLPGRANREILTEQGEAYYEANRGLDVNRDGKITVEDLDARLMQTSRAILQNRPQSGQTLNAQGQAAIAAGRLPAANTTVVVPVPAQPVPVPAVTQPSTQGQEVLLNSRLRQLVA